MSKPHRIDIASAFADCVESIGGEVLDRSLPKPASCSTADYVFRKDGVVAELKCMEHDIMSTPEFQRRINEAYARWVRKGLVPQPEAPSVQVDLRELPEPCVMEFMKPFKRRLEATVKKANKQIRETKEHLDLKDAKGLLLLANDGNLSMKPDLVFHLLDRMLRAGFRSINSLVYFSVNHPVSVPGMGMPALLWAAPIIDYRDQVDSAFMNKLRDAWLAHHSRLVEGPILEFGLDCSEPSSIDAIDFVPEGKATRVR